MDFKPDIGQMKTPQDVAKLAGALSEMSDQLDTLYTETAPNGNISGRQGQIALYNNSGTYSLWLNTTGSTVWVEVTNQSGFVTGDWIVSSVNTARTGWTNVSATYADKFMRINATPLSTGGVDAHTHAAGSYTAPSHTHATSNHTHTLALTGSFIQGQDTDDIVFSDSDGGDLYSSPGAEWSIGGAGPDKQMSGTTTSGGSSTTGSGGDSAITGVSASADNIPAYVQVCIFEKD